MPETRLTGNAGVRRLPYSTLHFSFLFFVSIYSIKICTFAVKLDSAYEKRLYVDAHHSFL